MNRLLSLFCVASLTACSPSIDTEQLIGNWEGDYNETEHSFNWSTTEHGITGYSVYNNSAQKDTLEVVSIYTQGGKTILKREFPNFEEPQLFTLTEVEPALWTFKSPSPFFPQIVQFEFKNDSLAYQLKGLSNGMEKAGEYKFRRK